MAFHRRMLFLSLSSRAKQAKCGYSASGDLLLTMCKSLLAAKRMRGDSEPSASTAARTSSGSPASCFAKASRWGARSEEHTSELQSRLHLVCRLLLEKKKK